MEQNSLKKSFYVFLTSLLGILLFVTIQKSLALIGIILLNLDYNLYSFGTNPTQIHALNIATMMLALFLGGWYGVWIGLHWYKVVYEQGKTGWLHGLSGGFFNHSEKVAHKPVAKIVKRVATNPKPKVHTRSIDVDGVGEPAGNWEFDDLLMRRQNKVVKKPRTRVKKTKQDA